MHHDFIRHCMILAENGRGKVSPNPLAGCVVVQGGCVLTEGFHNAFGAAHAEREALKKASELAQGATLYVNLEPCCTEGKQPPCTDAIIRSGITRVVFGAHDASNPGADTLRKNGIEVIGGILEEECRRQNRGFFSLLEQDRPWVTVKKALRSDGSVPSEHVTNKEQDTWAHTHLRAMHDAIIIGSGTVMADDPALTVRHAPSRYCDFQPRRVILDPHGTIPSSAKILNDEDAHRNIVIREKLPIAELLERLKEEHIASVLVEGGPAVWQSFEESGCVDEVVTMVENKRP
jgi:diaminohydroxyphosphoribosylaminopyrimidine deaminase/5-amino-6-(5-phosphoribosylamino)uracil reductase